jgi:hypothetical protein
MEMRISFVMLMILLAAALPVRSQTPMMTAVEPPSGKAGDVFVVQGSSLDQTIVAALYLTDGKNDVKVLITEQTAASIKFQVLPQTGAGRFALMVLTKGKNARYIEEPVKITIEAAEKPAT